MKNSFFAIAFGLLIASCNYDKSSNGNIDQAYAKEDYAAVHGQHKREVREMQKAQMQSQGKDSKQTEVKDSTANVIAPASSDTMHGETHH